jgi:hypothetical protein
MIFLRADVMAIGLVFSTGGLMVPSFESSRKFASLIHGGGVSLSSIQSYIKSIKGR